MGRRVPIARRFLFGERRRAALSTAGVAVALLLVLILDGIFAGATRQVTAYLRTSPADVIVSQAGVRTMHMSSSALPPDIVGQARKVPGVAWAEPIWFETGAVGTGTGRQLSYVIGYTPGRPGGPRHVVAGRAPASGEAVVDRLAAGQLGLRLGDPVRVLGRSFRLVGLSQGGTSIVNTTTFVTAADLAALRGPSPSYVLVGAQLGISSSQLRDRLAATLTSTTVQTRAEFAGQEGRLVADMSSDTMRIIAVIGFVIALAVIGLTLFTVTLSRLRDYGILKALGARPARLAGAVLAQAAWTVVLAVAVAVALAVGTGAVIARIAPTVSVAVTTASVARTGVGAVVVGALAAVIPLRRVLAVDPASAFRRTS